MNIVTLTLNPALDKSTVTERLIPEQKLRCENMQVDPGGGGINVSKGIRKLDGESVAVFPSGGANGRLMQDLLTEAGIQISVQSISNETRENFSVTESATNIQYRFTMSGAPLREEDADACLKLIEQQNPAFLVASGSLPAGLPTNYFEKVAAFSKKIGAKFILDTSGAALQAAADEGVFLLKPNLAELSALVGVETLALNQVDDAALQIIKEGKCEVVVVSLGPQGALLVTKDMLEHVPAPPIVKKSTVGAGDSMVAGMVWALQQQKSYREMVQIGVACGSAATMNTGTHLFEKKDMETLLDWILQYGERYRITNFD
ncbi:MAG: 1-phosphofructokinase family hexose kinase [Bacteroidota bacterium]